MRIALDAMGSDNHPQPELEGVVEASKRLQDTILFIGPEELLKKSLTTFNTIQS